MVIVNKHKMFLNLLLEITQSCAVFLTNVINKINMNWDPTGESATSDLDLPTTNNKNKR